MPDNTARTVPTASLEVQVLRALKEWHYDGVSVVAKDGSLRSLRLGIDVGVPHWMLRAWVDSATVTDAAFKRAMDELCGMELVCKHSRTKYLRLLAMRFRRTDGREVVAEISEDCREGWCAVGRPAGGELRDAREWRFAICSPEARYPYYALTAMGLREVRTATPTAEQATPMPDSLGGYESADALWHRHGIRPQRLSEAKRDGKVRSKPAPQGMFDSDSKDVRVLYNVKDAEKHCMPKRVPEQTRRTLGRKT